LSGPRAVTFSPNSATAFVVLPLDDIVTTIDVGTSSLQVNIVVGDEPNFIALTAAAVRGFVTNGESDNVSVIDPNAAAVVATVAVGDGPFFVVLQ